jgi:GNAT superfamily N-acetyltransferase
VSIGDVDIRRLDFEAIFPIWRDHLWPNRKSKISPINCMKFKGGIDPTIRKMSTPTFFGAFKGDDLIGVNSCFFSSPTSFRSRGLYVFPAWRNQGVARTLLRAACEEAKKNGAVFIWSAPRESSLAPYLGEGFQIESSPVSEGFEFGPNIYVSKSLISKR